MPDISEPGRPNPNQLRRCYRPTLRPCWCRQSTHRGLTHAVRPPPIIDNRRKLARPLKFNCGAKCISHGQSDQGAASDQRPSFVVLRWIRQLAPSQDRELSRAFEEDSRLERMLQRRLPIDQLWQSPLAPSSRTLRRVRSPAKSYRRL